MNNELKQFILENKDLINQNTKESWEEIYKKFPPKNFTSTLIYTGIDPAEVLGYVPESYLKDCEIEKYKRVLGKNL